MLRKIVWIVILIPLGLVIVAFLVANRADVTVSFDPFGGQDPALSLRRPLYLVMLVLMVVGVFVGGVAAWLGQRKWRRRARRLERELAAEHAAADRLREQLTAAAPAPHPLSLRPPAA
jgi:uncharacterized integral membrane protein